MPAFIKELEDLAQQHREAVTKIKQLETQIALLEKNKSELEHNTIPDAMLMAGLLSCELSNGDRIEVKDRFEARMPKKPGTREIDRDRQAQFYEWLQANGYSGLIQSKFEIYTKDPRIIAYIKKACELVNLSYEYITQTIHYRTLDAWFEEQTKAGVKLPTDLFESWIGRLAVIKKS